MKKRVLRGILVLNGILLLLIVALSLADWASGVPCGPRTVRVLYFGCSRYAVVALLLIGFLVDSMIVTPPLLLFALIEKVDAVLRRAKRARRQGPRGRGEERRA